jgi:hypothetical protein
MFSFLYTLLPNLTEYMRKIVGVLCQVEIHFVSVLFVFVLCLVYLMLLVSLDGPFLTAPSDPLKFTNDFYKAKPV